MAKIAITADHIYYEEKLQSNGALLVDGDRIVGFDANPLMDRYAADGRKVIARGRSVVIPGLINLHCHMPMVYFRGMADDLALNNWLHDKIWPAEKKWLSPEFCKDATLLAAAELLLGGVTFVSDMYFHCDQIAESLEKIGLRGLIGNTVFDFPSAGGQTPKECLDISRRLIDKYKGHELISTSVAPHAPYTTTPDILRQCRALADKTGTRIQIHAAETAWEDAEIKKRHGMSPIELLDQTGILGEDSILAHCVHLSDSDLALLKKSKANVAHCISSNLKLASGFSPVVKMQNQGINVGFGTDGAASGNNLDLLGEMSTAAKVQKALNTDATVMNAETVLKMATKAGAAAVGRKDLGTLAKGFLADITIISFHSPNAVPVYNPISHLSYAVSSSDVSDVFIGGRHIVNQRKLMTIDIDEVTERANWWADKIKR